MPDIDPNITIDITGNTAAIATDYVTSGLTNSHVQLIKLVYGGASSATRVSTGTPLPVQIYNSSTITVTGSVAGIGNIKIINGVSGVSASTIPLIVSGTTASGYTPVQINGYIQGITSGIPVGITGHINIREGGRIQGMTFGHPIAITGGRYLSYTADSVTVTGSVAVSGGRILLQGTDSVRVYGSDGSTGIQTRLYDSSGNSIGSSGGAINVNITNAGIGITATVTVGALVGISQADQTIPFFIAGSTAGPAVRVIGSSSDDVSVSWSSAKPVTVSNNVSINDINLLSSINALPVSAIKTNTDNITTINTLLSGTGVNAKIVSFDRPGTVHTGVIGITAGTAITPPSNTLKTGVTLKAAASNSVDVLIKGNGANSAFAYPLSPADILFVETGNLSNLSFFVSAGSATVYYIAS
jgi:hypothetical protein